MRVYLVQHGESLPEEIDSTRPLSEQGKADVLKVAKFLKKTELKIEAIWHSTKLRAKQTAQLFGDILLPSSGIVEKQGLAPNDPVQPIQEEILNGTIKNLMVVGHLPFLSKLVSLFLINSDTYSMVGFRQGGVVCLEQNEKGNWWITWMIIPDLLKNQ